MDTKDLIAKYMDYTLTHNEKPKSVYQFTKELELSENEFYAHFGTFDALEKNIFTSFFEQTHSLIEQSENFDQLDAKNKLLTFYFTFFELLTANRSYVVWALSQGPLESLPKLKPLRKKFKEFVDTLDLDTLDLKKEKLNQLQQKGIAEASWAQLLVTLSFWMKDDSPAFEKTDIFIEKSIQASFDLIETTPLKNFLDLGKFMYKEVFVN